MKTVGERIRQAREHRGLSGDDLAKKVGYKTQSGISNLENRSSGHGGEKLPKIAEALDFSIEWFLNGPDTNDISKVPPFRAYAIEPTKALTAEEPIAGWGTPRSRAISLINKISDKGLLQVAEYLELIAEKYPRNDSSAGVHVPVRHATS